MKSPNTTLQDRFTDELRWDPTVDAAHIGVAAENGAATLSGHVHNCIRIKPATSAHDVEKDIRAALQRRTNLDANGVHVAVRGNVATLTGTVSPLGEDRAVWWAASAAPGIERVVDQLVVRPTLEPAVSLR
jgi:osmotically-inducible protein OsmY